MRQDQSQRPELPLLLGGGRGLAQPKPTTDIIHEIHNFRKTIRTLGRCLRLAQALRQRKRPAIAVMIYRQPRTGVQAAGGIGPDCLILRQAEDVGAMGPFCAGRCRIRLIGARQAGLYLHCNSIKFSPATKG